jgi:selenocysteine lyase/cysteine desulfurase
MNIQEARLNLPVTRRYAYLDHAATGPLPKCVARAVESFTSDKLYGDLFWESWEETAEKTRRAIAGLLNARTEEIALVPNTSEGLGIVGNGLDYKREQNIVTSNLEFTSNLFIWQALCRRYRMELRVVEAREEALQLDHFRDKIDGRTRIVAVSHVQFSNGFKMDLDELCKVAHENGAYVVTDAVQSVGQMPVNVRNLDIDFLACSGYKWLLSPIATGFLYVKRRLINRVYPTIVGYRSTDSPEDFSYHTFKPARDARRFEHGQINFPGFAGMLEAIQFLTRFGIRRIETRIRMLTDLLVEGINQIPHVRIASSMEPEHRSGIVKLSCRNPELLERELRKEKIITSVRSRGLRVSPHFYNSEHEIERLLKTLSRIQG